MRWLRQDRPRANTGNNFARADSAPSLAAWLVPLTVAPGLLGVTVQRSQRIVIDPQHAAFPVRAVAVLKKSGVHGNMAVYFDWGEYVPLALWDRACRFPTMAVARQSILSRCGV